MADSNSGPMTANVNSGGYSSGWISDIKDIGVAIINAGAQVRTAKILSQQAQPVNQPVQQPTPTQSSGVLSIGGYTIGIGAVLIVGLAIGAIILLRK